MPNASIMKLWYSRFYFVGERKHITTGMRYMVDPGKLSVEHEMKIAVFFTNKLYRLHLMSKLNQK